MEESQGVGWIVSLFFLSRIEKLLEKVATKDKIEKEKGEKDFPTRIRSTHPMEKSNEAKGMSGMGGIPHPPPKISIGPLQ